MWWHKAQLGKQYFITSGLIAAFGFLFVCVLLGVYDFISVQAASLPASAYIEGVIGHPQSYSLSCESRSAVDWMAFWGVKVSEIDFLNTLPRSDNPDTGFVGSPNDPWGNIPPNGYGVHAKPVAKLLRKHGFKVKAWRGIDWEVLRKEIAAHRPVIVWVIGQMWTTSPRSYTAADGKTTTVASFEHTMVLIGYDDSLVYLIDAYSGLTQAYTIQTFLKSWGVLGNMAILGQPAKGASSNKKDTPAPPTATQPVEQKKTEEKPERYIISLPVVMNKVVPAVMESAVVTVVDEIPLPARRSTYIPRRR